MRRQLDLKVEDYIGVSVVIFDERVSGLLSGNWTGRIGEEVRAPVVEVLSGREPAAFRESFALVKEWDVEGIGTVIGVSQLTDEAGKK
jgi:hypothetical protein